MPATLMPAPRQRFVDNVGLPLANGMVFTFAAGTSDKLAAFQDPDGLVPHENPIRLDIRGEATIYWLGNYKVDVRNALGIQLSGYPVDNFNAISAADAAAGGVGALTATLSGNNGADSVSFKRAAAGSVKYSLGSWHAWQPVSVLEFMTEAERADVMNGSCQMNVREAVQKCIDYCLSNKRNMTVPGLCRLDSAVNVNRPVNGSTDEFHIIGLNSTGGFWTNKAISMFSSSIPGFTLGGASSEFVVWDNLRFEASSNTVKAFAVDGDAFLRIKFNECYWRNIRNAYTSNFFQSWYFTKPNVRRLSGIWMEAGVGGDSYVGLDGFAFDINMNDPNFEEGDMVGQSQAFKFAGQWNGGSVKGGLFQGQTGPFVEVVGGGTVVFEGIYFEAVVQSCFKLGSMFNVAFNGCRFGTGSAPTYFPIDCQTAYTVVGVGNFSEGNIYKSSSMRTTRALNDAGFYKTVSKGLISIGDVAYNGNITDAPDFANNFQRLQTELISTGKDDFTFGAELQTVAKFRSDGVSGVSPTGSFNWKTKSGSRDTMELQLWLQDKPNGEYGYPLISAKNDSWKVTGYLEATVGYKLPQFTTGARPASQPGVLIYDSSLGKLLVGEAGGWKVVTTS